MYGVCQNTYEIESINPSLMIKKTPTIDHGKTLQQNYFMNSKTILSKIKFEVNIKLNFESIDYQLAFFR